MGTMNGHSRKRPRESQHLSQLLRRREQLVRQLDKMDATISRIEETGGKKVSLRVVDRWLDQLTAGLPNLPALPADFSRADIYDDHD
jgi:hypothetical protein